MFESGSLIWSNRRQIPSTIVLSAWCASFRRAPCVSIDAGAVQTSPLCAPRRSSPSTTAMKSSSAPLSLSLLYLSLLVPVASASGSVFILDSSLSLSLWSCQQTYEWELERPDAALVTGRLRPGEVNELGVHRDADDLGVQSPARRSDQSREKDAALR